MFSPLTVTVKAGTTVTWTNLDDEPHTVFSDRACSTPRRWIRRIAFPSSSTSRVRIITCVPFIRA